MMGYQMVDTTTGTTRHRRGCVFIAPMKGFPLEFGIGVNDGATRWSKKFKIGLVVLIQYRL